MSNQTLKFYKFSNSSSSSTNITAAKAVEGAVIYIVDLRELWIGGSTPKLVIKGANDVTYDNNVLTVTHYDTDGVSTSQTLDFSDVASAQATLAVFNSVYGLMGATVSGNDRVLDYSSDQSGILHKTGQGETDPATLVAADLALAEAIGNAGKIDGVVINTVNTVNGNKIAEIFAENAVYGEYDPTNNKLATVNSVVGRIEALDVDTDKGGASISGSTITINAVQQEDGLIKDGGSTTINLDGTYDATDNKIATESTVSDAIEALDANSVMGVAYTAADSSNGAKLTFKGVSQEDGLVKQGIGDAELQFAKVATTGTAADVAIVDSGDNFTATDVEGALAELAGKVGDTVTDVTVDGPSVKAANGVAGIVSDSNYSYDASNNPFATVNTVSGAIKALDGSATIATYNTTSGIVTLKAGITETDGVVSNNSDGDIELAKVAKSGAAEDVSIADAGNLITATNVEGALQEIATNVAAMAGGMRYNGDISTATATLNTSTNDIRPGDIYLVTGAGFSIGTTTVEAGDMIVYKGAESTSEVALTASNCTIIERETDTMVTAGDTLSDDCVVFGKGSKEVTTTSNDSFTLTATQLNAAVGAANSALQSISRGTDGNYVTTTVGTKDSNNDQSVAVNLTYAVVNTEMGVETAGVLSSDNIANIKTYIDNSASSVIEDLDVNNTTVGTNVKVSYEEKDGIVTITNVSEEYTTVDRTAKGETGGPALTVTDGSKLATGSDIEKVKLYADDKIAATVEGLDADKTDTDNFVTVTLNEVDGVITTLDVVANVATVNAALGVASGTENGALTGNDVTKIKDYIDAKAGDVTNLNAVLGVNDGTTHTLATVGGTNITTQVTLNWEEYE